MYKDKAPVRGGAVFFSLDTFFDSPAENAAVSSSLILTYN